MDLKKIVLKLFICFFIILVQSIHGSSIRIVNTGSTINLQFKASKPWIRSISFTMKGLGLDENKYDARSRQNIIEFQILNVTTNDTGIYWIDHKLLLFHLNIITSMCIVTL